MEKKSTIIGMPMMAITEGTELGVVKALVIDADAKRVTHLVLGNSKGLLGYNMAAPIEKIVGVGGGRDFITVLTSEDLVSVWSIGEGLGRCMVDDELIGLTVISSMGNIEGKISDFSFDIPGTGAIEEYNMEEGIAIEKDRAITIAPRGIFVNFNQEPAEWAGARAAQPQVPVQPVIAAEPEAATPQVDAEFSETDEEPEAEVEVESESETGVESEAETDEEEDEELGTEELQEDPDVPEEEAETVLADSQDVPDDEEEGEEDVEAILGEMDYFVRRQSEFLLGREVLKNILGTDGSVLAEKGTVITARVIKRVRDAGKLTELSLNA